MLQSQKDMQRKDAPLACKVHGNGIDMTFIDATSWNALRACKGTKYLQMGKSVAEVAHLQMSTSTAEFSVLLIPKGAEALLGTVCKKSSGAEVNTLMQQNCYAFPSAFPECRK
jgi:hypothetical protein